MAITAFALAHAHEARWLVKDSDRSWSGVRNAPYVLAESRAAHVAKERQEEQQDERKRHELSEVRRQKRYQQMMAERSATRLVPPQAERERPRRRDHTAFEAGTERLEEADDLHFDPVIWEILELGGLRADLITDISEELRPKARAIPGFLRPEGKDWLALAQAHYNEPGVVVVEDLPTDWWSRADISYETVAGYAELVHFGLDNSFPDLGDEHSDDGGLVESLCSCQRPSASQQGVAEGGSGSA